MTTDCVIKTIKYWMSQYCDSWFIASTTCHFSYHRPSVAFMRHLRNCPKTNGKQIGTQFILVLNVTIVILAQFNESTLDVRGKWHQVHV